MPEVELNIQFKKIQFKIQFVACAKSSKIVHKKVLFGPSCKHSERNSIRLQGGVRGISVRSRCAIRVEFRAEY